MRLIHKFGLFAVAATAVSVGTFYGVKATANALLSNTINLLGTVATINLTDDPANNMTASVLSIRLGEDQANQLALMIAKLAIWPALLTLVATLYLLEKLLEEACKPTATHPHARRQLAYDTTDIEVPFLNSAPRLTPKRGPMPSSAAGVDYTPPKVSL